MRISLPDGPCHKGDGTASAAMLAWSTIEMEGLVGRNLQEAESAKALQGFFSYESGRDPSSKNVPQPLAVKDPLKDPKPWKPGREQGMSTGSTPRIHKGSLHRRVGSYPFHARKVFQGLKRIGLFRRGFGFAKRAQGIDVYERRTGSTRQMPGGKHGTAG